MTVNFDAGYLASPYHVLSGYLSSIGAAADSAQVAFERAGPIGVQVQGTTETQGEFGSEVKTSNLAHSFCPGAAGYLDTIGYLSESYLSTRMCVSAGAQFQFVATEARGCQVLGTLYNTTNLRILHDYDTRGDDGLNWTSNSTEISSTDSFNVNNLNTDIVDQVWQSSFGTVVGISLDCDLGSFPSFMDTLAFLNHNMTTSAVVTIHLSDNPAHAPTGESFSFDQTLFDSIYIAENLPTLGWDFMRIDIDDPTNLDGFIYIGTVVGGSALVMTDRECFTQNVKRTPVSFADGIQTEAFSYVRNFRGIRYKSQMTFKNMLYTGTNWSRLDNLFNDINTTLKALWIPTPAFPLRYMTYAKLTRIPEQNHNVISEKSDWINFTIDTDEAL